MSAAFQPLNRHKLRIAVVTNMIPHYRVDFFRRLFAVPDLDVTVYCQADIPGSSIRSGHDAFAGHLRVVKAWSASDERLAWQFLPVREVLGRSDVIVFSANPRVLSTVVLASVARAMGKPVIMWGQGHTAGARRWSEALRLWWLRRFEHVLLYVDAEIDALCGKGFARHALLAINNGLDQQAIEAAAALWPAERLRRWRDEQGLSGRPIILSCARLIARNRFDLLLQAMEHMVAKVPRLLWCAVGDGPEAGALARQAVALGLQDKVRWVGALYSEAELAPWFMSASVLCHPGAIGLTLNHAFGYGLPVVTHDDTARHNPEIHYLKPGINGAVYRDGDPVSLAGALMSFLAAAPATQSMGKVAIQTVRTEANTAVMAQRFRAAVAGAVAAPAG